MIVAHTITMSTAASGTLRSPEKIGMNSKLATRLMANGTATSPGTLPWNARMKTNPKLPRIIGYRIIQIRLIVEGAGVHEGFAKLLYQSIQVIRCSFMRASSWSAPIVTVKIQYSLLDHQAAIPSLGRVAVLRKWLQIGRA